ncbi:2-hydroxychromene-2-carboxylate isomerase [Povalibacter uvarum]|uniref:2-hydroxychromene-2-carboxylate isomerase n=1 Tax=Povalibacter uvarum TaxID=732238 RepID=A0A841HGU9_9GAMM|nr:hypothetical protein [Povalibacter uvarum]MBB6091903.1 2-hydroxychromene-2-carboxylate isomerase [Povalibacter uvarum]
MSIDKDQFRDGFKARLQSLAEAAESKAVLEPLDIGGIFLAIGTTMLSRQLGEEQTIKYLRELATEYETTKAAPASQLN